MGRRGVPQRQAGLHQSIGTTHRLVLRRRAMTYYGGKEMAASFRTVRNNTIKIAEEVPEDKYAFCPAPDCRSIGKTLTHIALGSGFQHHIHINKITDLKTVNFPALMQGILAEEAKPRNKAETVAFLKSE